MGVAFTELGRLGGLASPNWVGFKRNKKIGSFYTPHNYIISME